MAYWSFANEQKSDAFPGAGRYIGMLKRLFVFGLMLHKQAYGKQLNKLQELTNEFEKSEVVPT